MDDFPNDSLDETAMTAWCRVVMFEFGFAEFSNKIEVRWNPRMRSSAGRAFWPIGRIELNPLLRDVSAEEVERTVRHELAHLLAHVRAGRRRIAAHGVEWQRACTDLGIAGEKACHRLPFAKRVMTRRFVYFCPCCDRQFPRVRRIKRGSACLACCRAFNSGKYDARFLLAERR